MSPRNSYFTSRRRRLHRRHLCPRCGTEPARRGLSHCAGCIAIKAIKASPEPSAYQIEGKESKRKRLLYRLDLIDEARRAVQEELDRMT